MFFLPAENHLIKHRAEKKPFKLFLLNLGQISKSLCSCMFNLVITTKLKCVFPYINSKNAVDFEAIA
mgnify:CR=1 FL=1